MVRFKPKKECDQLVREIYTLKALLEGTEDEKKKEKIKNEIQTKEQRYIDLECGAIDPIRGMGDELKSSSSSNKWKGGGGEFSGGGASGSW